MKYKAFTVTGIASTLQSDGGLVSTIKEPKRIDAVLICVTAYESNIVEGWIGNEMVLEIRDNVLDTIEDLGAANFPYSTTKMGRIPIYIDLEVGESFKIGIRSGLVLSSIEGAYEWSVPGAPIIPR